ncbi:MAG TPA: thiamine phosphate synthase [Rhizomicrobium sp.]|jgi:thiamine-phosphate pyrophosphorylase
MAEDKLARAQLARAASRFAARRLPPLVLMTDDTRLPDPAAAACRLPFGSLVILRSRNATRRAALAKSLRGLTLLIADDPYLAARCGAQGLHLPEHRAHEALHWRARHPGWLITASAHSLSAITRARGADAVILAPVFATASHPGGATLGAIRARIIAQASPLPVYALGGIDAVTARALAGAKLAGLAAIGALA